MGRGDPGRAGSYQRAADRQRAELDRTTAYARSLGCDRTQFLFFGSAAPPQCGQVNAQIARMTSNLQGLQQAAAQAGGGGEDTRRELVMRFNAYCADAQQATTGGPPRQKGFFDFLFGNDNPQPPQYQQMPLEPAPAAPQEGETAEARSGSKAVCVRSCDGSFFPVSYSARHANLDGLNEICHALCPNSEVTVYTYSIYRDIDTAVSLSGTPYSELPNALKYQKNYDPACTCRPPGKSWAETLADAESMLRAGKTDLLVTPEKAAELSRAKPVVPTKAKPGTKPADLVVPEVPKPVAPPAAADDPTAAEGAVAAQVPTASKDSAGISAGTAQNGSAFSTGQGETREIVGPDGVKRRVRIIAPTL